MASEDSDELRAGLLVVHGLRDLRDRRSTLRPSDARLSRHELHAALELLEVLALGRS